ncbi:hydantoinase/oxoprolinase family protein [Desulfolutivibrio sulfoxidireducens]|uniref:hydantoinase/oxoprolinase family protein n=1 Tax=Desulfolutivibrio sulfoxidireducens TaxID=2773299 RepID=UPI00159D44B0|nr:hydantoinase/oxoprolinase family protein [Desulfolutivibrio sulfoxidireducens]QLA21705.1 hydantoinase/oxoprolinase family protein [Desulfolutivibrio sulfoxidireducens]
MLLGIDVGGTHTDAVLIGRQGIVAMAKIRTNQDNLLASITDALESIVSVAGPGGVSRLNLSTTLSTNAIVEGKTEPVGVFVSAGPGIDPELYRVGEHYFTASGCIDHRGEETAPLDEAAVARGVAACRKSGITAFAAVSKFSIRNPVHERRIKELVHPLAEYVAMGHDFSGRLGFSRRINTAYYNSAVWRLFNRFADAVQKSVFSLGLRPQIGVLKADGGTMPLAASRLAPIQSILSGPAASVMGIIAICDIREDAVILDIGGTTTDMAVFAQSSPLIEREGIAISGRPTLVRALRVKSIGVGGDSAIRVTPQGVTVGPRRLGPSMAFGGTHPTLVDALNVQNVIAFGDVAASFRGMAALAEGTGHDPETLADFAIAAAVNRIREEVAGFVREINDRPVYTITEMLEGRRIEPTKVYVMGGPALALSALLQDAFSQEIVVPENFAVANAVGAALARPTFSVELFADTARGGMVVPSLGVYREVPRSYDLKQAEADASGLLREHMRVSGASEEEAPVETVESSSFHMVEDSTFTGRNIRVVCQVRPGVLPRYREAVTCPC